MKQKRLPFLSDENITKLKIGTWYDISKRTDISDVISDIKKHIDDYGTAELNNELTKFRLVYHPNSIKWMKENNIKP